VIDSFKLVQSLLAVNVISVLSCVPILSPAVPTRMSILLKDCCHWLNFTFCISKQCMCCEKKKHEPCWC